MRLALDDFYFMRQGRRVRPLLQAEASLLAPIDIRGPGQDTAILLLHGFGSSPAVWRAMIPELSLLYDAVVCPVLPGHAENLEAFSNATAQEWLAAAKTALYSLTQQYERVDVMGLSLGGLMACHLSHLMPIHQLYLLAPALKLKKLNIPLACFGLKILKYLGIQKIKNYGGDLSDETYEELLYHHMPLHAIKEILQFIQQYDWQAPACPTDLFLGQNDSVVDSALIQSQFKNIAAMKIHVLLNSAHVLPLDHDRTFILNTIKKNAQRGLL